MTVATPFGREAIDYGLLNPNASEAEIVNFWYEHLDRVFAAYPARS